MRLEVLYFLRANPTDFVGDVRKRILLFVDAKR